MYKIFNVRAKFYLVMSVCVREISCIRHVCIQMSQTPELVGSIPL
jgi:hypothetical protein